MLGTRSECSVVRVVWICNWNLSASETRKDQLGLVAYALVRSSYVSVSFAISNAMRWLRAELGDTECRFPIVHKKRRNILAPIRLWKAPRLCPHALPSGAVVGWERFRIRDIGGFCFVPCEFHVGQ